MATMERVVLEAARDLLLGRDGLAVAPVGGKVEPHAVPGSS